MPQPAFLLALCLGLFAPADPSPEQVRHPRSPAALPVVEADALAQRLADAQRAASRADAIAGMEREHEFLRGQFRRGKWLDPELQAKQIAFLIALIDAADPDDPELPDYLFRLADHYIEQRRHHQTLAVAAEYKLLEIEF